MLATSLDDDNDDDCRNNSSWICFLFYVVATTADSLSQSFYALKDVIELDFVVKESLDTWSKLDIDSVCLVVLNQIFLKKFLILYKKVKTPDISLPSMVSYFTSLLFRRRISILHSFWQ